MHIRIRWHNGRDQWLLKGSGGRNNPVCDHIAVRCFDVEITLINPSLGVQNLDPAANGGIDLLGKRFEIRRDIVLGGKIIRSIIREGHCRKTVMPRWPICHQRIPTLAPPPLRNPVPFKHQMGHASVRQMLAHRKTCLPATNDQCVYMLGRHECLLGWWNCRSRANCQTVCQDKATNCADLLSTGLISDTWSCCHV